MTQRHSRQDVGLTEREDKALQRNTFARRHLDADLEAAHGLEKIHLQTIRNEKMKLQKELERMRGRGQRMVGKKPAGTTTGNNMARLTQLRLNRDPKERFKRQQSTLSTNTNNYDNQLGQELVVDTRSPRAAASQQRSQAHSPADRNASHALEAVGRGARQLANNTIELPAISSSAIKGARSPRNGYRNRYEMGEDFLREQQLLEHRRSMSKKQDELLARVEKFGENFEQYKLRDGNSDESNSRSPAERSEASRSSDSDGRTVNFDPNASFPPAARKAAQGHNGRNDEARPGRRSNSFSESNLQQVKEAIVKRLVSGDDKRGNQPPTNPPVVEHRKPGYNAASQLNDPNANRVRRRDTSIGQEPRFDRSKGTVQNVDMIFDQDTYAPDGSLRTVHLLPDSTECFEEAKKARYLRWRGPQEEDFELSVNEIFGKEDGAEKNTTEGEPSIWAQSQ